MGAVERIETVPGSAVERDSPGCDAAFDPAIKTERTYKLAADLFRAVCVPVRLKILDCLCAGEQNVSELLSQLDTSQSNLSHHVNSLYHAGLLARRQVGTRVFYAIVKPQLVSILRGEPARTDTRIRLKQRSTGRW